MSGRRLLVCAWRLGSCAPLRQRAIDEPGARQGKQAAAREQQREQELRRQSVGHGRKRDNVGRPRELWRPSPTAARCPDRRPPVRDPGVDDEPRPADVEPPVAGVGDERGIEVERRGVPRRHAGARQAAQDEGDAHVRGPEPGPFEPPRRLDELPRGEVGPHAHRVWIDLGRVDGDVDARRERVAEEEDLRREHALRLNGRDGVRRGSRAAEGQAGGERGGDSHAARLARRESDQSRKAARIACRSLVETITGSSSIASKPAIRA